jgi:hypothetical protein
MKMNGSTRYLLAILLGFAPAAYAARACVSNTAQLALVLSAAQDNGEDDVIALEVGNYLLDAELDYFAASGETYDLSISGGYEPGTDCHVEASAGNGVLDGQGAVRPLYINANGRVNIHNLSFVNGHPTQYAGGPYLDVESNVFVNNEASSGNAGGAVYLDSQAIILASNLFVANTGSGAAAYLENDDVADVNNNTMVGNTLGASGALGALVLTGAGHYNLGNNLVWSNEGWAVYDQSGNADYWHNDIESMDGFPPLSETGDISAAPQFDGFFSFQPVPASPLVNAGLDSPLGGIGATDAGGGPRLVGRHVDIGAYETDVLFRDGLEPGA